MRVLPNTAPDTGPLLIGPHRTLASLVFGPVGSGVRCVTVLQHTRNIIEFKILKGFYEVSSNTFFEGSSLVRRVRSPKGLKSEINLK